jgi:ribose 5-phosphate isomerase B
MIIIGSDHRGFDLKNIIYYHLCSRGYVVEDVGCHSDKEPVDYPDYAFLVANKVVSEEDSKIGMSVGILICGSGVGMSIASNKIKGVRAALCFCGEVAKRSRLHNNANVLCLGSDFLGEKEALDIVDSFIHTNFEGGRHQSRLEKIE